MHKAIQPSGKGEGWGRNRGFRPCRVTVWSTTAEADLDIPVERFPNPKVETEAHHICELAA
jgi:hypothetical protein